MSDESSLRVLAVEPFYGGSHRAFLDRVIKLSRHAWTLVTGSPVHWKWRMRSAPLTLAHQAQQVIGSAEHDVVFCSSMLDLPAWRGMIRGSQLGEMPAAVYFHESQWTYPLSPTARVDHHYGYTNLLTALSADACWFNSQFHRDEFLNSSQSFVGRMPDTRSAHEFDQLRGRCDVIPPGFEPPESLPAGPLPGSGKIRIGWVSRWEHDKRPDRFIELLAMLEQHDVDFQLVLLGARPEPSAETYSALRDRFGARILHDGYVESQEDYWRNLQSMDVIVSTADHEFFGIAVCEAIWAGAAPVLPDRLSYPELVPNSARYQTLEEAASMIISLQDPASRDLAAHDARESVRPFRMEQTVAGLDDALQRLVGQA